MLTGRRKKRPVYTQNPPSGAMPQVEPIQPQPENPVQNFDQTNYIPNDEPQPQDLPSNDMNISNPQVVEPVQPINQEINQNMSNAQYNQPISNQLEQPMQPIPVQPIQPTDPIQPIQTSNIPIENPQPPTVSDDQGGEVKNPAMPHSDVS